MVEARRNTISSGTLWIAGAIALVLIFFGVRWMTREKLPVRVAESQVQDLIKVSSTSGKVDRTRPLCPYPQVAKYKGSGSIDDEANFTCSQP